MIKKLLCYIDYNHPSAITLQEDKRNCKTIFLQRKHYSLSYQMRTMAAPEGQKMLKLCKL